MAGAWDDFATEENADNWGVFDFSDDSSHFPIWNDAPAPDIFFFHGAGQPLWFFTEVSYNAGGGAFMGNYREQDIRAIRVSIFIESLEHFDAVDCAVETNGPAGVRFYYSDAFFDSDFDEAGWWTLTFPLDDGWSFFDDDGFVPVTPTPDMFQNVTDIGFRFFLKPGVTEPVFSAITNVQLVPTVVAPPLETAVVAGQFQMTIAPQPGNLRRIEEYNPDSPTPWLDVAGHIEIATTEAYLFSRPTAGGSGIFRVHSQEHFVPIVNP